VAAASPRGRMSTSVWPCFYPTGLAPSQITAASREGAGFQRIAPVDVPCARDGPHSIFKEGSTIFFFQHGLLKKHRLHVSSPLVFSLPKSNCSGTMRISRITSACAAVDVHRSSDAIDRGDEVLTTPHHWNQFWPQVRNSAQIQPLSIGCQ